MKNIVKRLVCTILIACTIVCQVAVPTTVDAYTASSISTGSYRIKNVYSGKYLNVSGSGSSNGTNVNIYTKDGTSGQTFKISKLSGQYWLSPKCASTKVVNVKGSSVQSSSNVNIYSKDSSGDGTQLWVLQKVSKGYVIRSAGNDNCVLAATGSTNGSNVCVKTYSSGSTKQIWTLEKVSSGSEAEETVSTDNKSVSQIKSQIASTYKKAKSIAGRSNFAHQCSLYVYSQLRALKIYQVPDTYWNGSGWYYNLRANATTSTGYVQKKYSGRSCLTKIINANNGKNVYNIVVSFPKSYRSSSSVGHVLFIHAIIDGKVYYSDNYTYNGMPEGSVIVKSVSEFTNYFASNYGGINGAVHFVK